MKKFIAMPELKFILTLCYVYVGERDAISQIFFVTEC
jgi:hypothetical protein